MRKSISSGALTLLASLALSSLTACSSNGSVSVALAPLTVTTPANGTIQFSAAVSGTPNKEVTWSVQEGSPGGSIGANGLYTAPAVAGTFHVLAASKLVPTLSVSATVTVTGLNEVSLTLSPTAFELLEGQSKQFTATVTGAADATVSWSVLEGLGGGTISSSGRYTAPSNVGIFHVVATSNADPNKTAVAPVTVAPAAAAVVVAVDPATAALGAGAHQRFVARVTGTTNTAVVWTVEETGGGTIDATGLYTAPHAGGTFHLLATSAADSSKSAEATITIASPNVISVALSPQSLTLAADATQQFIATVTNALNPAVTWSIDESGAGRVDANGLYTAPHVAGTFHVRATSLEDPAHDSVATVKVNAPLVISVSVAPQSAAIAANGQQQFIATVTNTPVTSVIWSVDESGAGTINSSGLYTAPNAGGTFHVRATSFSDPTQFAGATVTVSAPAPITVVVSPPNQSIAADSTQQFSAAVSNTSQTAVTWSVQESGGGLINANGLYTAPHAAGTYHVNATSVADTSKSGSATINVAAPPSVSVSLSPTAPSIAADAQQLFTASVTGSSNSAVTYSVQESSGGAITTTGLYTAPHAAGTFHVVATSNADTSKSATATVTVAAPPPVSIAVTPKTGFLQINTSQQLTATVSYASDTSVTWTVVGTNSGTVTSGGIYTAPGTAGTYSVKATSNADTTKSDTATFSVTSTPPTVSVTVTPGNPEIATRGSIQLNAQVSGSSNQKVDWSVISSNGGTVSTSGLYTAPGVAGSYTVKATSQVNSGNFGTATVKVDSVNVAVAPTNAKLPQSGTQQFTANVIFSGTAALDQTVVWSVQEGAAGGTINASGLYTAPAAPTVAHVVATSNADSTVSNAVAVTVTAPIAAAPTNLVATSGNQQVTLTWTTATGAVSYNVYFAPKGALASVIAAGLGGASSGVVISGLTNGQAYDFAVTSVNTGGESGQTPLVTATPLDKSSPGQIGYWPLDKAVAIPLTVAPYIEFNRPMNPSTLQSAFTLKKGTTAIAATVTYDGLRATFTPNTVLDSRAIYTATLASTALDTFGNAFPGFTWTFTTQAEASGALRVLVGNSALTLSWDPVPGALFYTVYRSGTSGGPYQAFYGTTGLSYTTSSVGNGTNYYYVVTATTTDGEGAPTTEAFGSPSGNVPSTPTNLAALDKNGQVILYWSYAGPSLTYRIFRGTASGGPYTYLGTSGNGLGYVDNSASLVNGTTYYYVVRSIDTQQNSSANSNEANATPSSARIAAPANVTHVNGNGYVTLSWSAVTGALGYVVLRTTTAGGPYTAIAQAASSLTSFSDSNVSNGTTYFYVVAAIDPQGTGTLSAEVEGDPASYLNTLAATLSVDDTHGYNGRVYLYWSWPPGATQFQLQRAIGSGTFSIIATLSNNLYYDSNLTDGATYAYKVVSLNQTFSATSNTVTATPQHVTIAPPTNVIVRPGPGQVTLSWTPSPGATSYTVKYGITSGSYTQTGGSTTTYPVSTFAVANGNPLYFVVIASGPDNGGATQTAQSSEVTTTPLAAPTLPSGPTNAGSIAGDGQVNLSWNPPVSTSTVTYNVYRTVGLKDWTKLNAAPTTVPWYIDTGLTNGTTYYYAIAPITNGTEDVWSATPFQLTPSAGALAPPSNVTSHPGNNYLTVTWDAMPGATAYYVYTSPNQGGPYSFYTAVSYYPSINLQVSPNQTPGQPGGYVIVRTYDQNGVSAYSPELPLYPDSKYPGVGSLTAVSGTKVVTLTWPSLAKATGYNIYRTTGNSTWQKIGSTTQFVTGFVDSTVTNDVQYYYAFSGVLNGTDSVWSNVITGSPHARTLPAPQNLVGRAGDASVTVTWDPVPGANQYNAYTATVAGGPYQYYTSYYTNALTLTSLGNGTPAHFVVTANAPENGVTSDYSAELTITPQANNPPTTISLVAPSFSLAQEQNEGVFLTWNALAGATGYHLYRSLYTAYYQQQAWTLIGTPSGQVFKDPAVTNGVAYQYAVAGVASSAEGPWGFSNVVTPKSTDPMAPAGLYTHAGNGTVTLSWDAVAGATIYYVYTSNNPGGPYSYVTNTNTPETNVGQTNGATGYFVVTAQASASSGYSQEASGNTSGLLPMAPSLPTPPKTSGQLTLNWSAVSGASSYLVYRYNPGAAHWTLIGQSSSTSFVDASVTNGTPYQYAVAALNGSGVGAWSYPTSLVTPG